MICRRSSASENSTMDLPLYSTQETSIVQILDLTMHCTGTKKLYCTVFTILCY